jgi:aerotaxis receptor
MKINLPLSGRQVGFQASANILSTTDPKGSITYVNRDFIDICGFSEAELLGNNHNIVRHPDMPPQAFAHMWQTLKAGRSWMGLVKNRCKNGDHYWVSAYATPVLRDGQVVEYQSVRTLPSPAQEEAAEQLYGQLRAGRTPRLLRRPRLAVALRCSLGNVALSLVAAAGLAASGLLGWGQAGMLVALLGLLQGGWLLYSLNPLDRLARKACAIADNPLSQALYSGRGDAFGQIDFALCMLEAETRAVVGRMADSARELNLEAAELVAAVGSSNQACVQQQGETAQVVSAIGQLASSVQEVARHAQLTASAASLVNQETDRGLQMVEQTRQQIDSLAGEVQQSSAVIHQLERHGLEINRVLEVIQGIAEQTNLLALNAAIEAARAGEAGRGFAVVADEVRGLASRTQHSTAEIQQTIDTLRQSTTNAVAAMQRSHAKAAASVEQAALAAVALDGINQRVNEISDMSVQIAAAVEQQSAVGDTIQGNLEGIREATDGNVMAGDQSRQAAHHVAGLATRLQLLAEQFWGDRGRSGRS